MKTRGPSEEIDFGPFHIAYGNAAKSYFQSIVEDAKKVSHLKKRLRVPPSTVCNNAAKSYF